MGFKCYKTESHLFSLEGMEGQQLHKLVVGPTFLFFSEGKWVMSVCKIRIDGISQFMLHHLKSELTWINGVRVFQNCGLSVCIHYGSNKVC